MNKPNWKNQTIWTGDNLPIMRGMNSESVDLIYLDPPFNSNRTYSAPIGSEAAGAAFKDTWTLDDVDLAWHGEIAEQNPAVYSVIGAAGEAHGKGMKSYLIMMAVRLLEMRRILKDTGSIYLHCDPTASHYLKLLLDAVFGLGNFRNEITWERTRGRSGARHWGNVTDTILFYSRSRGYNWRDVYRRRQTVAASTLGDLTAAETRNGISGKPWQGYDPSASGRHWAVPRNNRLAQWIEGNRIPGYLQLENPHKRLDALNSAGLIEWSDKGRPSIVRPAEASAGAKVNNLWNDITRTPKRERTGYPTQKPLALLDLIIKASSNEGDVVLDPFAGCATACVAAERLDRQWVGIDISEKAAELVQVRIRKEIDLFHNFEPIRRTDIPKRTDLGKLPDYRTHKHLLFGKQEGRCAGCQVVFPFRNFTIDHVVPQSKGGSDHFDNLQMLCGACNSLKGDRDQAYLVARLRED